MESGRTRNLNFNLNLANISTKRRSEHENQAKMKDMLVAIEEILILDKYMEHCSVGLA